MDPERPDLDDYQYLATGLPVAGLVALSGLLRFRIIGVDDLGHGLPLGLIVGAALVSILAIQLHMWKDLVARAVVEFGNPRLPIGFTLGVAVYFVGVIAAAFVAGSVFPADEYSTPGAVGVALVPCAFLPWVVLLWPMREIRRRADDFYRERDKEKFGKLEGGDGQEQEDVIV